MLDEEFRVSAELVAEQDRAKYNWEKLSPIYLAPAIIADSEIAPELEEAIRQIVKRIAESHDKPLQKVEVIDSGRTTRFSNRTVYVRWTSSGGVFEREFEVVRATVHKVSLYSRPAPVLR